MQLQLTMACFTTQVFTFGRDNRNICVAQPVEVAVTRVSVLEVNFVIVTGNTVRARNLTRMIAFTVHCLEQQRCQQVSTFQASTTVQLLRALQLVECHAEAPQGSALAWYRRHNAADQQPNQMTRHPHFEAKICQIWRSFGVKGRKGTSTSAGTVIVSRLRMIFTPLGRTLYS